MEVGRAGDWHRPLRCDQLDDAGAVVLLDIGVALGQVSTQSSILNLSDTARGRINTIYIVIIFVWGTIGSAAAAFAWARYAWAGVVLVGLALSSAALGFHLRWYAGMSNGGRGNEIEPG